MNSSATLTLTLIINIYRLVEIQTCLSFFNIFTVPGIIIIITFWLLFLFY